MATTRSKRANADGDMSVKTLAFIYGGAALLMVVGLLAVHRYTAEADMSETKEALEEISKSPLIMACLGVGPFIGVISIMIVRMTSLSTLKAE
uniref:Uncharacterized protein n=1 Tax=Hemiselmis andersenii TaxID=464988 RepID=A0A6U5A4X6_HEMAN